jgi:hypothetical protein
MGSAATLSLSLWAEHDLGQRLIQIDERTLAENSGYRYLQNVRMPEQHCCKTRHSH